MEIEIFVTGLLNFPKCHKMSCSVQAAALGLWAPGTEQKFISLH